MRKVFVQFAVWALCVGLAIAGLSQCSKGVDLTDNTPRPGAAYVVPTPTLAPTVAVPDFGGLLKGLLK